MSVSKLGVHKTMSGSGVYQCSNEESGMEVEVSSTQRELGSERVDVLRQTASIVAQEGITQSSGCAEARGLLSLFLVVPPFLFP